MATTAYEDDWKSKHIWRVIQTNSELTEQTILIFTGDGRGSGSELKGSGLPNPWGFECTYQADGTVTVKHGTELCTITRDASASPVTLTCRDGLGHSFTAKEEKDTSVTSYSMAWKPTRLWTVETSTFSDLPSGSILIFKGNGDGDQESYLENIEPLGEVWGSECRQSRLLVNLSHKEHGYRVQLDAATQTLDCDTAEGSGTGTVWTAEEGG